MKTCLNCGKQHLAAGSCPFCGAAVVEKDAPTTKAGKAISRKIAAKQIEFDNANGYGPTVVAIIGVLSVVCLIGIAFLIVAAVWANNNATTRARVMAEIAELEDEQE